MELAREFNGAFKVRAGIARLKSGMLPIVQARRQHFISIGRIFIAKIADVIGHAEDFLNEDEPAPPRAFRLGVVDGNLCTVRHFHTNRLTHKSLPRLWKTISGGARRASAGDRWCA